MPPLVHNVTHFGVSSDQSAPLVGQGRLPKQRASDLVQSTSIGKSSRSDMRRYPAFRCLVAFGAAVLLAGCVGEPRTYDAAKPIVLQRRAVSRVSKTPVPASSAPTSTPVSSTPILSAPVLSAPVLSTPVLSTDEKQQLFQDFQASQGIKEPIVTAPGAAP